MMRMTFCLRRLPALSWDEFSDYWHDVHAPLVAANASVLGIRRYVQVRTARATVLHEQLRARNGGAPAPFDGVAEIWLDGLDAFERPPSDEARRARRVLLEDERRFIDLPNSPMWVGQEWQVLP